MNGLKLGILGICIALMGLCFASNDIFATLAGCVSVLLALIGLSDHSSP